MKKDIENLESISIDDIKQCLKKLIPGEFDKMIISGDQPVKRANYFYVKYKSTYVTRQGKIIRFPLYDSVHNLFADVEGGASKHGMKKIIESEKMLEILSDKHNIFPKDYTIKSINNPLEFNLDTSGELLAEKQRKYYIPELTFQSECDECKGKKYVTCDNPDCRGEHIYTCTECKGSRKVPCDDCRGTGWVKCRECGGSGEKKCKTCKGRGEVKCKTCKGDGRDEGTFLGNIASRALTGSSKAEDYVVCKKCGGKGYIPCSDCRGGFVKCEECNGKGEVRCETCNGRGEVDCPTCDATGKLTCGTCYGDRERYGLIDCPQCKTTGIMAQMVFVETTIHDDLNEKLFHSGDVLEKMDENAIFSKHPDKNEQTIPTLININENVNELYDEHTRKYAKLMQDELGYRLNAMPLLTNEEINLQIIPCVQVSYKHMLTNATYHVTIVNFFNNPEVFYETKAETVKKDLKDTKKAVGGLFGKIFKTKSFKTKEDKKNEIILMIYLAKADGVIEEGEKIALSDQINSLDDFTANEKQEIFNLMNSANLPELTAKQTTFSSRERAEEVVKNLEYLASADGEIESKEKEFIDKVKLLLKL